MGRISSTIKLPPDVRCQLDDRLRTAAYGDAIQLSQWLKENGHDISKSGLNRYAIRLRTSDASRGIGVAPTLTAHTPKRRPRDIQERYFAIITELGQLQGRQTALLAELTALASRSNLPHDPKNIVDSL